jgi:hypothetical protein
MTIMSMMVFPITTTTMMTTSLHEMAAEMEMAVEMKMAT